MQCNVLLIILGEPNKLKQTNTNDDKYLILSK